MLMDLIMSCSIGRREKKRYVQTALMQIKCSLPRRGADTLQAWAAEPAALLEAFSKARQGEGCYWLGLAFLHKALGTEGPAKAALEERGVRPMSGR